MGKTLDEILLGLGAIIGIPSRMFARAIRNQETNILALVYHDITRQQFESHMHFLDRYFDFIDLDRLVRVIKSRGFPSDLEAVITFDDGLESFFRNALPILDEMGIPATAYITSGVVNSSFWSDERHDQFMLQTGLETNGDSMHSGRLHHNIREGGISIQTGLSLSELQEAGRHPHIILGAHSVTHPNLPEIDDEACKREIHDSKVQLEKMLGHRVLHFAYPYGLYSSREIDFVREAGFKSAAAVSDEWIGPDSDVFCFPRKGTGPVGSSIQWLKYRIWK
ncbi:MAG: polysaccharide deacetylase family protein [Candidatus Thorarchaeota archaeon]